MQFINSKYIFGLNKSNYEKIHKKIEAGIKISANLGEGPKYPIKLIVFLDTSLSMNNNRKLAYAIASMDYLIGRLDSSDKIDLVTFNTEVASYSDELTELTDQNRDNLRIYLKGISASGKTNLEKVFDYLSQKLLQIGDGITAIILLTDGETNIGLCGKELYKKFRTQILPILKTDISLHTFGYGKNHNSYFLNKIASNTSQGLYYYIPQPEFIGGIFGSAIFNLKNIVMNNINIKIKAEPGTRILAVSNTKSRKQNIKMVQNLKEYEIKAGNLLNGEDMVILILLSINKATNPCVQTLLNTEIEYFDTSVGNFSILKTGSLQLERSRIEVDECAEVIPDDLINNFYRQKTGKIIKKGIKYVDQKLVKYFDKKINDMKISNNEIIGNLIKDLEFCKKYLLNRFLIHPIYSLSSSHYCGRNTGLSEETINIIGNDCDKVFTSRYYSLGQLEEEKNANLETTELVKRYTEF